MARKNSSLKRKKPNRNPKQKFILFSEGANTERVYFEALERHYTNALFEINFIGPAGTPITIADKVKVQMKTLKEERIANSFAEKDTVWGIFDEDNHDNVRESIDKCIAAGAKVAYSNPCFEVWLILHYEDFDKSDDRHQVQKHYGTLDPYYKRNGSKIPNYEVLIPKIEEAEERAVRQEMRRESEGAEGGRPSTTVYSLTKAIRKAAKNELVQFYKNP